MFVFRLPFHPNRAKAKATTTAAAEIAAILAPGDYRDNSEAKAAAHQDCFKQSEGDFSLAQRQQPVRHHRYRYRYRRPVVANTPLLPLLLLLAVALRLATVPHPVDGFAIASLSQPTAMVGGRIIGVRRRWLRTRGSDALRRGPTPSAHVRSGPGAASFWCPPWSGRVSRRMLPSCNLAGVTHSSPRRTRSPLRLFSSRTANDGRPMHNDGIDDSGIDDSGIDDIDYVDDDDGDDDGDGDESGPTAAAAARSQKGATRTKGHRRPEQQQQQPLPELSSLAQSVRDRVWHLVDVHRSASTTTTGHAGTEHDHTTTVVIPIVVAVSGGCDSVALFHALLEWNLRQQQQELPHPRKGNNNILDIDITVVHFHHRQRPVEADEDCALVRELVTSHNNNNATAAHNATPVAFRLEDWWDRVDGSKRQRKTIPSSSPSSLSSTTPPPTDPSFSQDAARRWRQQRLHRHTRERISSLRNEDRRSVPFGIVLTAHHDDDSYETVLIKLLRGVHLMNLHDKATIATISPMNDDHEEYYKDLPGRMHPLEADTIFKRPTRGPAPDGDEHHEGEITAPIYLVRPFVASATTTISQPPLWSGHTKSELVEYLTTRNLRWREDASNHDPNSKYIRNRVRNELIPLLKDMTDDSFRTKRIPALLAQSLEAKRDLEPRVDEYHARATATTVRTAPDTRFGDKDEANALFAILPPSEDSAASSRLVRSQALHRWMTACLRRDGNTGDGTALASPNSSDSISYDCLQRVVKQVEDHPHRKRWTLEIGSNWNLRRVGDFLTMARGKSKSYTNNSSNTNTNTSHNHSKTNNGSSETTECGINDPPQNDRIWTWRRGLDDYKLVDADTETSIDCSESSKDRGCIALQVPSEWLEGPSFPGNGSSLEFVSVMVREAEEEWNSQQRRRQSVDETKATTTKNARSELNAGPNNTSSLRFVPPWRTSPRKLRAFLRGQNVPVHERDTTQLLLAKRKTTMTTGEAAAVLSEAKLVAVCIRERWIVDRKFYPRKPSDNDGAIASAVGAPILLTLQRRLWEPM